ncbi:MAG: hypothetical protein WAV90_19180 [Gordonia amarae]
MTSFRRDVPRPIYVSGDLVELRADAEHGFRHLFEVVEVAADGTVWLSQRGTGVRCRVLAADVPFEMFLARPDTIAAFR